MSETPKSLALMLEEAKCEMTAAVNQVIQNTNLPAYLMEGIIVDLLSQVRNQKNLELVQDYNRMNQTAESKEKKDGEK